MRQKKERLLIIAPFLMDHHHFPSNEKHQFLYFFRMIKRELVFAFCFLVVLLSSIFVFDLFGHFDPRSLFRFGFLSQIIPNGQKSSQRGCDYSYGRWVRDENYTNQSYTENCQFLDPGFRCVQNGRKDVEYLNWRWQPEGSDVPRFKARELLERSRNGRIVFAGDSIGRNQWESFLCMLAQGVSNKSSIYEVNGNPITKHKGFLSMRFSQYNLTVEYYRAPFLVFIGRPPHNSSAGIKMTIQVDQLHWYSKYWEGADVLVFNTGHWWNEDKTIKMGYYFEDGGKVNVSMNVMEAFQKSLQTWKLWSENLNSHVFFRGYSPVHYRNGTWDDEGRCDMDIKPETNHTMLEPEPAHNQIISNVIKEMEYGDRKVQFLNITHLTQFRYDGHPSLHREPGTPADAPQDCSHWCLPGIPDIWNEILYASLLSMGFRTK